MEEFATGGVPDLEILIAPRQDPMSVPGVVPQTGK